MSAKEAMYLIYVNHQSCTSSCRSQVEEGFIPEDMIEECTKRRQELIGKLNDNNNVIPCLIANVIDS